MSRCQEEDCKPKTQKKVKEEVKELCEPKLKDDDPLSVLTTIIAQVQQQKDHPLSACYHLLIHAFVQF